MAVRGQQPKQNLPNGRVAMQLSQTPTAIRNRQRRANKRSARASGAVTLVNPTTPIRGGPSRAGRVNINNALRGLDLSPAGVEFLKAAFAAPDFNGIPGLGIPDRSPTKRFIRRHKVDTQITLSANTDYYYLIAPIPGYAYFWTSTAAGTLPTATSVWTGVYNNEYTTLFGFNADTGLNVDKFRYMSQAAELVPTVNEFTWSGSIKAYKMPVSIIPRSNAGTSEMLEYTVTGLQNSATTNTDMYSAPFRDGVYAIATKISADFEWTSVLRDETVLPATIITSPPVDWGQLSSAGMIPGCGQHDSIMFKVLGTTANQSMTFRSWAVVEYAAASGQFQSETKDGPPEDLCAFKLYSEIAKQLPPGVRYSDNPDFWKRVLGVIQQLTEYGAFLPGPYGQISVGLNAATRGLQGLLF